jgi:hypothetical protein
LVEVFSPHHPTAAYDRGHIPFCPYLLNFAPCFLSGASGRCPREGLRCEPAGEDAS